MKKITCVAYSSQGTSAADWQMAVRRDNVIRITLSNVDFLKSDPLFLNQVVTQLSSRGWVDPVPDLFHI